MILSSFDFYTEFDDEINSVMTDTYAAIEELPRDGHYKILVVPVEPLRTVPQNKYYWLLLSIIEDHTGHDKYELHRCFAIMFNMELEVTKRNELIIFGGSTTEIKEKKFKRYLDSIRMFSLDFMGITQNDWDKAMPPRNKITEEMLWKCGIET